jgi:hypothetical protein
MTVNAQTTKAMKPRHLNPLYWLNRFIQINREIAVAIPPFTGDDIESVRKFREHLKEGSPIWTSFSTGSVSSITSGPSD